MQKAANKKSGHEGVRFFNYLSNHIHEYTKKVCHASHHNENMKNLMKTQMFKLQEFWFNRINHSADRV